MVVLALRLNWFGLLCNLDCTYRTKSSQLVNSLALLFIFLKTRSLDYEGIYSYENKTAKPNKVLFNRRIWN